ncbi:hypothetical protein [Hyalangium rubrum]|uniref:Lipoprotein n=1 Tax=Hyalangium rubrum TaxID=3103134 RepID=A0ABU5H7R0_9BACT|nr:hypothetical protein [Hyalangium sp. s54d21]MDY7229380.1 hypothetical protein [Hyalangium sp. s54d21]
MHSRRNSLPPRNRRLRRTVARLLVAVPALSLTGCPSGDDGGCIPYDGGPARGGSYETLLDGGVPTNENCMEVCLRRWTNTERCEVQTSPATYLDGGQGVSTTTYCHYYSPGGCASDGRLPEGLLEPRVEAHCALGAHFAQVAWMEAASVPAFLRLADELKAHGAPEGLVRAARRSAGDEVRHTRVAGALARRHGASVPEVELRPFSSRSLEDMVLENAREGCVRETFGAVVAAWQARHAQDAQVREELGRIAEDELRHAELAWAVDAWAAEQLTPAERQRVRTARIEAFHELERLLAEQALEDVLIQQAGLPSRDAALHLLRGLQPLIA